MSRAPITKTGSERLRAELERLKSTERPRIIAAIAEARAHGDLKENAEYHAARELQSFTEGRIAQLEGLLSTAEVIDVSRLNAGTRGVFGATVDREFFDPYSGFYIEENINVDGGGGRAGLSFAF